MANARQMKFSVLNVVAQPHPPGIYRRIFEKAAGNGVRFWGDEFAALSPISETRDGVFSGRLAIWTQVDKNSDVIRIDSFEQLSLRESEVSVPNNIGLNSKVFVFAFNEKRHHMYIEMQNDERKHLSPKRAERPVYRILAQLDFTDVEDIKVHMVPEQDSVEKVLQIPGIKRVEMRIHRPNPDDLDDEANRILDELQEQGLQRTDISLTKAPGVKTIALNAKNTVLAKVAALNGYIKAFGRSADGTAIDASTKDHPQIVSTEPDPEKTASAQVRYVARD